MTQEWTHRMAPVVAVVAKVAETTEWAGVAPAIAAIGIRSGVTTIVSTQTTQAEKRTPVIVIVVVPAIAAVTTAIASVTTAIATAVTAVVGFSHG